MSNRAFDLTFAGPNQRASGTDGCLRAFSKAGFPVNPKRATLKREPSFRTHFFSQSVTLPSCEASYLLLVGFDVGFGSGALGRQSFLSTSSLST